MYFIENVSIEKLISEMDACLYHRQYDSSFGDFMTYILANTPTVNIVIVFKMEFDYDVIVIGGDDMRCVNNDFITVYKCGTHYDAMALIHGTSVGMCNRYKDDMFTCDSGGNNSHVWIGNVYNFSSVTQVSSNIARNNPDTVSCRTNETREIIPDLPICYPGNDFRNSMKYIKELNIHGLSQDKLSDDILGAMLKGYGIILLSETWTSDHDGFVLEGFEYHNYPRKCMHLNSARNSGGLGVFIRQSIREGIDIWCYTENIGVWYILRKPFFGIKHDIYMGNVYIVPEYSTYLRNDEFYILYKYIEKYQIIPKSFCVAITTPGLVKCQISRHRYLALTEI